MSHWLWIGWIVFRLKCQLFLKFSSAMLLLFYYRRTNIQSIFSLASANMTVGWKLPCVLIFIFNFQIAAAFEAVDILLDALMEGLYELGVLPCVDIMLVSDHGMIHSGCDKMIPISSIVPEDFYSLTSREYYGATGRFELSDAIKGPKICFFMFTLFFFLNLLFQYLIKWRSI